MTVDTATLLAAIIPDEVTGLCRDLVRIPSVNPPGNEEAVARHVAGMLSAAGLQAELVPHAPGRASLLAWLRGSGGTPGVLFSAHLDTVAPGAETWSHDPFSGDVCDGKLWGRGASDMKGGLAAMVAAACALARTDARLRGDLVLAFTAGEEVDCLGANALSQRPDLGPVQAVVVSEPTSNELVIAEKGALWLELTTTGRAAHGSMPHLGRNAVMMMVTLLGELDRLPVPYDEHPLLGGFTRSINTVAGGQRTNVVPDRCTATVDLRTVPGQSHAAIVAAVQGLIDRLAAADPAFQATVAVDSDRGGPLCTEPGHPVVGLFTRVIETVTGRLPVPCGVRYLTDAVAFVPMLHAPLIICGPGRAELCHQPDEYVEVVRLGESARILALAAAEMLG
jgi:succinyl-diaminopimelate desuccinylase